MAVITFGDLLQLAAKRLAGAEPDAGDAGVLGQDLHRIVTVLAGLSADALVRQGISPQWRRERLHGWECDALDACHALQEAAGLLDVSHQREAGPLAAVAATLAAARDLLNTHHEPSPSGELAARSPWAEAVASAGASRALTAEVARWSALLIPWTQSLAHTTADQGSEFCADIAAATRCLRTASSAGSKAQATEPNARALLHGVPAATPPPRVPPADGEQVTELCAGIAVTAQRLRLAAFSAAGYASWSPAATARAWQQAAVAAAIVTDMAEPLLRTLAQVLATGPGLLTAAQSIRRSHDAWRNLVAGWTGISTETSQVATRANTELGDLVLRLGRLAFDNPEWTPAREHHQSPLRSAPALVRDQADIPLIIAAVHHAVDALAMMAAANFSGVTEADRAGRFYVPTRSLPDGYDVPRAYAPAPDERIATLKDRYQTVVTASQLAARHLADLALSTDAPSRPLAFARRVIAIDPDRPENPAELAAQDLPRTFSARAASSTRPTSDRDLLPSREQGRRSKPRGLLISGQFVAFMAAQDR